MDKKQIIENLTSINDKITLLANVIPEKIDLDDAKGNILKTLAKLKKTITYKIKPLCDSLNQIKDLIVLQKKDDKNYEIEQKIIQTDENIMAIYEKLEILDLEVKKHYILADLEETDTLGIQKQIHKIRSQYNEFRTKFDELGAILIETREDIEKIGEIEKLLGVLKLKINENTIQIEKTKQDLTSFKNFNLITY